ncbi:3',5'-cyclic-nucleotide phosphodiesterase [Puccinia graminis f. sp. tritici]|uniref:Phosphodiesterase n=1 Tax=Puccinia graminis f. sp. tritici TaxID=56615 RepID=A0A5B0M406_PUCGR|nr:3',5'-cyclic-nucleotide phosphodiesterase [Puccinia graminis f. sp. tritici]
MGVRVNTPAWIAHHLSIVLQHSFTVSSPHPIPSSTNPESLPNRFLNLRNSPVPEALRNKVSITSLSSFTTSTTTDEDEDNETDDVEEAKSQDSTASSCYFPNLNQADSCSSQPRPSTPRSHPSLPPVQHSNLPPVISEPPPSASRLQLLRILNTWSFDANSLSPLQIRCSLHVLLSVYLEYTPGFTQLLTDLGVVDPEQCLQSLVDNLEVAYDQRNAYHNFRHAVDVVQAVYTMLSHEGIVPPLGWVLQKESDSSYAASWERQPVGRTGSLLDEMTVWALLLAAAGHDVGHPGLSNAFMVNARTPIAYVFSDGAVLENFHRITFTRMLREHGFGKVIDGHAGFRQVMVGAVLATDMGRHFPIVEELKRLATKWATSPEDDPNNTDEKLAAKVLLTAGLIKCGDISNSSRPHHISLTWSSCLLNEWSRQAALEADLCLPVSVVTLDPAEKRAQAKSQIGFTTLFVLPLFTVMEQLSPKAFRPFADNCRLGLKTWQKVVEQIDSGILLPEAAAPINPKSYPSHRSRTSSTESIPAYHPGDTSQDPHPTTQINEPILSPLSSCPSDSLFSHPAAMGSISSPSQSTLSHADTHSTPKARPVGWWGGDFGLSRRNRTSLPFRKASYSPHLVSQQVACAKGCGKVTVKCVKCAAASKLKMYRSLSLAKGTFSILAGLTEEQPAVAPQTHSNHPVEERSWPPYPFRPLG